MIQTRIEFAKTALPIGLEIFRANVPIDTEELRSTITGKINYDKVVIDIQSRMIHSGDDAIDAKKLALVLNIGLSDAGKILLRTRNNLSSKARRRMPTADWINNAITETHIQLAPIGRNLIIKASNLAAQRMIEGS